MYSGKLIDSSEREEVSENEVGEEQRGRTHNCQQNSTSIPYQNTFICFLVVALSNSNEFLIALKTETCWSVRGKII